MAEGVGFEPTVRLPVRLISSQVPSTTQPPFPPELKPVAHFGPGRKLKYRTNENDASQFCELLQSFESPEGQSQPTTERLGVYANKF